MENSQINPNCCANSDLATIRVLYEESHDFEAHKRCKSCGAYWFYRFHELVNFGGGQDDITTWLSPLTDDEAHIILNSPERPDLSFLQTRRSIMEDDNGKKWVNYAPDHPWS